VGNEEGDHRAARPMLSLVCEAAASASAPRWHTCWTLKQRLIRDPAIRPKLATILPCKELSVAGDVQIRRRGKGRGTVDERRRPHFGPILTDSCGEPRTTGDTKTGP